MGSRAAGDFNYLLLLVVFVSPMPYKYNILGLVITESEQRPRTTAGLSVRFAETGYFLGLTIGSRPFRSRDFPLNPLLN